MNERTVQYLKLLLEASGNTSMNHSVCRGKSPGVKATMHIRELPVCVCKLRKHREKRLEK